MSESFDKLRTRILSDARVKAESVIKEAEEKARVKVEEARAEARKDAEVLLSKTKLEAEALRRSILSSKIRANRLKVLDEKNRIIQSVLRSVEEQLASIAQSEMFREALKNMVNEALAALDTDEPIVRVGFRQVPKRDIEVITKDLPKGAKLIVEDSAIDDLGGVVASDPQGRLVYNNSFKARLERLDAELLSVISSTIFGE